ncbi:hypothetical protein Apa02nite_100410 [Actinoplanes palleronii]|uniref:DUF4258 domain-containing protein n=1 Tax=Actinoplanes palleronii TaxID=113570 RepID=A0ABQ4BTB8_9ACTN|nr:hypothetical protein Apa02nite_100410 [Actinoplanes palleronii]
MSGAVYIAEIHISAPTERKINTKHYVTSDEVREALVLRKDVEAAWDDHPQHGRRVVALGQTAAGRPILAVLQEVDPSDGVWNLRTARSPRS